MMPLRQNSLYCYIVYRMPGYTRTISFASCIRKSYPVWWRAFISKFYAGAMGFYYTFIEEVGVSIADMANLAMGRLFSWWRVVAWLRRFINM